MNWTYRRPFRQQINYNGNMNKVSINRREDYHVRKDTSNLPIDAIRLQLADYDNSYHPCPVHHRNHPYITTLSDQQSSLRRTHSSVHSVSTVETDFVHQRVSTIHTYPSSPSIIERQQIINEENDNQPTNINNIDNQQEQQQSNQCRTCLMLIEIVDQQTQQIRQYTEQITQQADLLAKFARHFAGIDEQKSDNDSEQQTSNESTTT